ncbi:MAG: FlgD immunoglobulin-like domain containing protein [Vicinamibacterales bacterium]
MTGIRVRAFRATPGTGNRLVPIVVLAIAALGSAVVLARQASAPDARSQASSPDVRRGAWADHERMRAASEFAGMSWDALGPSRQSARVEAIALSPSDPFTMYVGPGAGNVWKTVDNGITWTPIFEHESAFAIGDIAVAPSDDRVVWVGTGEVQPRHSGPAFAGTGVFKSTDAGGSWTPMGLDDTQHIGKIVIHPTNPDIVYVAAMGHFRSTNPERGVFRTTDGGRTWQRSLFVSERTGVIDLVMDPSAPETLYAWAWQLASGPESGLYKTTDAGATWTKVAGGLPTGPMGRAGLAIAPGRPATVYAFLDNWAPVNGPGDRRIAGGEVYRSDDRGTTWRKANTEDLYDVFGIFGWKFCDIRVAPDDPEEIYILGNRMFHSTDGGRTYTRIGETIRRLNDTAGETMHLDHHELVIDPRNPARLILGNDGGVFQSFDRGRTWLHHNTIPIGQFYYVAVDDADPYHIYAGTQDDGALMGPSTFRIDPDDPAANDPWRRIWLDQWTGGDAFVTLPDPTNPNLVYYEHQNGDMRRMDMSVGNPYSGGPATEVVRPRPGPGEPRDRFSWFTPFFISPHDPRALYAAGTRVYKTTDRGATWRTISPDLGQPGGEERDMVPTGAVTVLDESPVVRGRLYAGTEGGMAWTSADDGGSWHRIDAGLAADRWVTRVVASRHAPARVYLTQSGYRHDDFQAYVFRSDDAGASWTPIARGLPAEPVNVIREDPVSPSTVYVGTDLGVYVSLDRGATWQSLVGDLPSTPVYDLVVHPREGELIAATHGRSLFLLDVRPIQAMSDAVRAQPVHVFDVRPVRLTWRVRREVPPQPPRGRARIAVWLRAAGPIALTVRDARGQVVRTLTVPGVAGVNTVTWDTRADNGRDVAPGRYRVEAEAAGARASAEMTLLPVAPAPAR